MLAIWRDDPYNGQALSQDGTFTNPLTFKFDATGGTDEQQLWVRHDYLSTAGESSYGVVIGAADIALPDQSEWVTFAPDEDGVAGTYDTTIDLGDILVGNIATFWIKVELPDEPDIGVHEDIYINVEVEEGQIRKPLDLRFGQFIGCEYDAVRDCIAFDAELGSGRWQSDWLDPANYLDLNDAVVDASGATILASYRTSSDGTEENATTWVGTLPVIPPGHVFQVAITFLADTAVLEEGLDKLTVTVWSNPDFSVFRYTQDIDVPASDAMQEIVDLERDVIEAEAYPPAFSLRWAGQIYVDKSRTYNIDVGRQWVTNRIMAPGSPNPPVIDGQATRLFIDGKMVVNCNESTLLTGGSVFIHEGWHDLRVESNLYPSAYEDAIEHGTAIPEGYTRAKGAMDLDIAIARATPQTPQEEHYHQFSNQVQELRVNGISIVCFEPQSQRFDMQLYDGPDVPVLIDPPIAFETPYFAPELTVFQRNCDHVEFQMDASNLFGSDLLSQWTEVCEPETEVTSVSPVDDRPPGIYYWRARGIKNGYVSAWSDWWLLEILPLVSNDEFLYVHVNTGLAVHDPLPDIRQMYLHVNMGIQPDDSIEDARMFYLNVNLKTHVGKIIYPFQDRTEVRKEEFEGDDDFIVEDFAP